MFIVLLELFNNINNEFLNSLFMLLKKNNKERKKFF